MLFSEIRPFVRYVHYLAINKEFIHSTSVPYDNRCFYIYRGYVSFMIENNITEASEGDVVIIPSGTKYRFFGEKSNGGVIGVNYDYSMAHLNRQEPIPPIEEHKYNPTLKLENVCFPDFESFNSALHIKGVSALSGRFMKLEHEYVRKILFYENITSNIFSEILFECARYIRSKKFISNSEIIGNIIDFVNDNMEKPLTNKIIAETIHMHPNYVSSLIKAFTGMPLHRYLMHVRISRSIEMLNTKNYSLSEIAEKCGFCSIYHYSKAFTKIIGVPPSKY